MSRRWCFAVICLSVISTSYVSSKEKVFWNVIGERIGMDTKQIHLSDVFSWLKVIKEKVNSTEMKACVRDITISLSAAKAGRKWAIQMFDSYGKFIEHSVWPGKSFCQNLKPDFSAENEIVTFGVEFCNLQIAQIFQIGVCLPESCKHKIINDFLQHFKSHFRCLNPSTPFWSSFYVLMSLFLCFVLVSLAIAGTLYEAILHVKFTREIERKGKSTHFQHLSKQQNVFLNSDRIKNNKYHRQALLQRSLLDKILTAQIQRDGWFATILISFSFYTNGSQLLNIQKKKSELHCLHGLRVLSILTVVYGHSFARKLLTADNYVQGPNIIEKFPVYLLINGAPYAVDTFLILSGLLLVYIYFKEKEKGREISWLNFYLLRIIRISPSYWFTVLILNFGLFVRDGIGPVNFVKMNELSLCQKSWWHSLLYITNLSSGEQCFSNDWYLSLDMQLFVISPVFLYLLSRFRVLSWVVCAAVIIASSFTNWIIASQYPQIVSVPRNIMEALDMGMSKVDVVFRLYKAPYCRIIPYVMGILAGFILLKKNSGIYFSKFQAFVVWCIAISGCVSAVMIPYWFFIINEAAAIFFAVKYILWSLGIISLVFLCISGYGGFINSFLSWSGWLPFSRLSFGVFLLERLMIYYMLSQTEKPHHFEFPETNLQFLGVIVMTNIAALFLYLIVEKPLYLILINYFRPKH